MTTIFVEKKITFSSKHDSVAVSVDDFIKCFNCEEGTNLILAGYLKLFVNAKDTSLTYRKFYKKYLLNSLFKNVNNSTESNAKITAAKNLFYQENKD